MVGTRPSTPTKPIGPAREKEKTQRLPIENMDPSGKSSTKKRQLQQ